MAEPKLSMTADEDLPRTLRREKEARQRQARERETGEQDDSGYSSGAPPVAEYDQDYGYSSEDAYEPEAVSVAQLNIPFLHLMLFFIKAVFAAIPALIILGALLYGMGQLLKAYMPWLIQAEILIRLPNN